MSVRELVDLDLTLHGRRLILLEFGTATPSMIGGGLLILLRSYWPLGMYILLLGVNYVPLLAHALALVRSKGRDTMSPSELAVRVREFGFKQLLILVPFSIPVLSLVELSRGHGRAGGGDGLGVSTSHGS